MNAYWNSVDHVTLPVKLVDGRWELLYGGGTGIRDGAVGELRIAVASFEDEVVRQRLTQSIVVKVLDEGAELQVALRDRDRMRPKSDEPIVDPAQFTAGCTRFERISIGAKSPSTQRLDSSRGGLWIHQRGVDRTELVCSSVLMPKDFLPGSASSLNHACTMLSERYEKHRLSHTLNVYQHVFYREPGNQEASWHPLEALRTGVIADMERTIMADAWRELEGLLGFRPIQRLDAKNRRRRR